MGSGVRSGGDTPLGLLPLDHDHPDAAAVMAAGDIEDEYEVEREPIARGKFAAVRRARHRRTGEIFAAKYIRRRRRAAAALEAEASARHEVAVLVLGRAHQHIAHLHRVYQTRQEYIILLEFGVGGDLQKLLDEQVALPEQVSRTLLLQVLEGLRFLHSNGIAHLDIKPQNLIMMGAAPSDGVKLVDFGLSRVISNDAELTQIMGTPDYVAPEVINFEPVGLATDMWSVGVLAYVFLTGCTPFGGDTDQETFVNITQSEYDFPDDLFAGVSEQAKDFISCLLLKKTSERLRVEDCLNHPWLCPVLASVYPSETPELYTLTESDNGDCGYSGDSAYSSDSNNSSPTFIDQNTPTFTSTLTVKNLCHCPIPEEQQQQNETKVQVARIAAAAAMLSSAKRLRSRSHNLSVDMAETLRAVRRQQRSGRRASMIIDDTREREDTPRYGNRNYNHQSLLNLNQMVLDNRTNYNNEYNNCSNRLRHSESFDCMGGTLYPWNDCNDDNYMNQSMTAIDTESLKGIKKPWQKICTGSVLRAVNQLTTKNAPKKKKLSQSRTDLCNTKPDLNSCRNDVYSNGGLYNVKPELRLSKSDIRQSKTELKHSRNDLRSSRSELRSSKSDLRSSNHELRSSRHDLRGSRHELRSYPNDIRCSANTLPSSKSDLRHSRLDHRSSNHNLSLNSRDSMTDSTLSRLDMSLSRLDLAHEQLDQEEEMEQSDKVRGDLTLPRRRLNRASLLHGNALHMSFRMSKSRDEVERPSSRRREHAPLSALVADT